VVAVAAVGGVRVGIGVGGVLVWLLLVVVVRLPVLMQHAADWHGCLACDYSGVKQSSATTASPTSPTA
jgi:hypothetical protein